MEAVLLASYQPYMVKAFVEALNEISPSTNVFDFAINKNNELSYDNIYEKILTKRYQICTEKNNIKPSEGLETALEMMDRNQPFGNSLDLQSRLKILNKIYNFWISFVRKNKIELVFFEEEPHQFFDYMLFLVSQEIGVETAWFERTLPQSGLLLKRNEKYIKVRCKNSAKNFISLTEYVEKMKGNYNNVVELMYFDSPDTCSRIKK